jgi:putative serine protease PepD
MDEQNRYPDNSHGETGEPQTPSPESSPESSTESSTDSSSAETSQTWFGDYGRQTEATRPIPPYQQQPPAPWTTGYLPPPAPSKPTRGRGLTATVLVGALVLGGAAGVGGSALFRAFTDDSSGTSTTTSGPFQATKTSVVQDGTVEKVSQSVLPSVVKVNVTSSSGAGSGSGIILSKDGKILTNNHVVAGAGDNGTITVNFNDGTTKRAKVLGTDPVTDVAVIQAEDASDLTPAALGKSSDLKVGQSVVAIGSPFGLNATVTTGIVSALNRPVSVASEQDSPQPQSPFGDPGQEQQQQQGQDLSTTYPAIQTDAAINPGNSGGPLVDMSGRVVGINSSIRTASDTSSSQGGSIGLGFSIPIDEVLPIVNQITDKQAPTHARLGVSVTDVSGNTLTQGAQLRSVENGGAADKAGLKDGDVITKVDDQVIDGSESLVATIRGHRPDDSVQITYLRGDKTHTTNADLGSDANTQNS